MAGIVEVKPNVDIGEFTEIRGSGECRFPLQSHFGQRITPFRSQSTQVVRIIKKGNDGGWSRNYQG